MRLILSNTIQTQSTFSTSTSVCCEPALLSPINDSKTLDMQRCLRRPFPLPDKLMLSLTLLLLECLEEDLLFGVAGDCALEVDRLEVVLFRAVTLARSCTFDGEEVVFGAVWVEEEFPR